MAHDRKYAGSFTYVSQLTSSVRYLFFFRSSPTSTDVNPLNGPTLMDSIDRRRWTQWTDVDRLNKPTSMDLSPSMSINSFSDPDYFSDDRQKIIRNIIDNPGRILSNNPGVNRVGKNDISQRYSPTECPSKIS